jgi:beta-lactamase class A/beta-lactamase class A VEB
MRILLILLVSLSLVASCQQPQKAEHPLKQKIQHILSDKKATVGVSIIAQNGKDTLSVNGHLHCPMQSTFKMHIALAILAEVDKGNLQLDQEITIKKEELLPEPLWSPLRDENPNGGTFTIARLIEYAIIESDNVSCDLLIRLIGSPKSLEQFFKQKNIQDISIVHTEESMQSKWENQYDNWITPIAASNIIALFYNNKNNELSKGSYEFLWRTMEATITGQRRLKGLLPEGTRVAHKTGSSGTNEEGDITAATNDMGVIHLPNGQHIIISVLVTESKENDETNERIIAEIARAAYDFYILDKQ